MAPLARIVVLALLAAGALAVPNPVGVADDDDGADQADGEDGDDTGAEADAVRPVAILEQKQEMQDDGTFNYAFSADNGLTQNEAFHPDGSRTGSYSYVDPKGETILVKYRADRFGFHVLDGSSIPTTPPHAAPQAAPQAQSSKALPQRALKPQHDQRLFVPLTQHAAVTDYGRVEEAQGVLDPNYFNVPDPNLGFPRAAATSDELSPGASKAGASKARARGGGAGRARSSASSSMHFLQREARQAFVSDGEDAVDDDLLDDDVDGLESRVALRTVRAPLGMIAVADASARDVDAGANDVDVTASQGMAAADDGSYDHHALKYDDGSYAKHAAKYDDGSYEPHAAKYDDGSYERHAANYDDGSYAPHAARYDDGSYEKYAQLYDDGSYKNADHAAHAAQQAPPGEEEDERE